MNKNKAEVLIRGILSEILGSRGQAEHDKFSGLREVDAKIREAKMIFVETPGLPESFLAGMETNEDFSVNSRRVRLEALANYCKTALRFLESGGFTSPKRQTIPPPDLSKLTSPMPQLEDVVARRWREAQKCQQIDCYTSAVIMMGSILEALLLCRASLSPAESYSSQKAPKDGKSGRTPPIHDWSLNTLVEVAVDVGWLKSDRGKFSHALRESRNVVHPYVEIATRANFDEATCRTSWEVLNASIDDLIASV